MHKPYVIGVDMGGTNTVLAVVDARGNILCRSSIKTNIHTSAASYVQALCEGIRDLLASCGCEGQINGIGVGAPNGNYYTGCIDFAANIPWANKGSVPLAAMIKDCTGLECRLTNDANAAALGEMMYGAARGLKDFIVITLGTGVGSGIVSNGQLVVGHDGLAGELGHVIVRRYNGRPCGCGRKGCLETYTSATGVARTAAELLELTGKPSLLRAITERPLTSKDVFEAAGQGDELAIDVFNYTGKVLGEALADFIAFSSPDTIILFGGLAAAGDFLLQPLKNAMDENTLSVFKNKTRICFSELKEADSALLGASAMGWEVK